MIGVTRIANGVHSIFEGKIANPLLSLRGFAQPSHMVANPSKLFYGTQMSYIFFRLHHILYTRLCFARQLASIETMNNPLSSHPLAHYEESDDDDGTRVDTYIYFICHFLSCIFICVRLILVGVLLQLI